MDMKTVCPQPRLHNPNDGLGVGEGIEASGDVTFKLPIDLSDSESSNSVLRT
jgi:hypothetical protein